ncbi:hypothetical protein BHYA_0079g00150 [Botrytis hyacinthi]|uniref:Uncharacterized protein n=1 Tax=Botrytis hyacinthi TaxID=278943 RepID=A0A4Z1GMS5_9HELO|nr:hypothetical protein BHYA_0079g00150 [Botrytis hyacinthi]
MRVVVQALPFSNNGTDKLRRSSERIPNHLPIPPDPSIQATCPQHECASPIILNSESILNRQCGATPTRSGDPEGTVLPGRPVTADLKPRQGTPKGPIRRPHATPVEKSAEKSGEPPEEIAKKLGESPEGDSMSNSGDQHELHLRNLSPSTEKISSRNPKEPVRDLYRPSRDPVEKFGSLSSLGPASPPVSQQPQEEPIRDSRRSLNKALKRDRRLLEFETNLRTWKLPARIFHQTLPPHKQSPPWASLPQFSAERQVGTKQDEETATPV